MQSQATAMNKIVAELLELSRLEGAGQNMKDERVDVCGLLTAARKFYSGRDAVPAIDVQCESAPLYGSSSEIESVITNLLSNAVRHTPHEGTVSLRWATDDSGGVLTVSDTGDGIDEERHSAVDGTVLPCRAGPKPG